MGEQSIGNKKTEIGQEGIKESPVSEFEASNLLSIICV